MYMLPGLFNVFTNLPPAYIVSIISHTCGPFCEVYRNRLGNAERLPTSILKSLEEEAEYTYSVETDFRVSVHR